MSDSVASVSLTPVQFLEEYNKILDLILGFGEDMPSIVAKLRAIRQDCMDIYAIVQKRLNSGQTQHIVKGDSEYFKDGFTLICPPAVLTSIDNKIFSDPVTQEKENKILKSLQLPTVTQDNVQAITLPTLRDIIMFIIQNPQLLALILSMFGLQPSN